MFGFGDTTMFGGFAGANTFGTSGGSASRSKFVKI